MDRYVETNAVLSVFCKSYMDLKKNLPIRPSEMGVLNIITETEGPHTPLMLAELLKVSKPMITAHLTSLLNKGYIEKQPSEEDKRAYYVLPTEKARKLVESAKAEMKNQLDFLMSGMGKEDFENFVRLAAKAGKIIDDEKGEKYD